MERLWAPWRLTYVADPDKHKQGDCVFCGILSDSETSARDRLLVHERQDTVVLMNRFPYNNGHLLVLPRQHVGRLDELEPAAFLEFHQVVRDCVSILETSLHADGVNVGYNLGAAAGAGIPKHLHGHIVPRWNGDTNFMPVVAETKVISQHILDTYDQIKPHFDRC